MNLISRFYAWFTRRPMPVQPVAADNSLPPPIWRSTSDLDLRCWLTAGADLHPATVNLVVRFARALSAKLAEAELKYGFAADWRSPDWLDECRAQLLEHVDKGDPRDVAAYCAFLWHHGSTTTPAQRAEATTSKAEPIGFISRKTLADLQDPQWSVRRRVSSLLWTANDPPSGASIPVYLAAQGDAPSAYVNQADILASDSPAVTVKKLDAAFHNARKTVDA